MTIRCSRLSDVPAPDREGWVEEFIGAGLRIRAGETAHAVPSRPYTELVLRLAGSRPSEMLLVRDGPEILGRALVAASLGKPGAAVLGLVEIHLGDREGSVSQVLIDAASTWAASAGHAEIFAPIDINTWFTYRFMVPSTAPSTAPPPYAWEPQQPAAYLDLFERAGFSEAERYRTVGVEFSEAAGYTAHDAASGTAPAYEAAREAGLRFEQMTSLAQLDELLPELHQMCMAAFAQNVLFEPLPLELFRVLYTGAASQKDCTLTHWMRDPGGALRGFVFAFEDAGAVIIKTIAVSAELRGRHLSTALAHRVFAEGARRGNRHFISALVREGNTSDFLSRPHLIPGGKPWQRDYTLLRRSVTPA